MCFFVVVSLYLLIYSLQIASVERSQPGPSPPLHRPKRSRIGWCVEPLWADRLLPHGAGVNCSISSKTIMEMNTEKHQYRSIIIYRCHSNDWCVWTNIYSDYSVVILHNLCLRIYMKIIIIYIIVRVPSSNTARSNSDGASEHLMRSLPARSTKLKRPSWCWEPRKLQMEMAPQGFQWYKMAVCHQNG